MEKFSILLCKSLPQEAVAVRWSRIQTQLVCLAQLWHFWKYTLVEQPDIMCIPEKATVTINEKKKSDWE